MALFLKDEEVRQVVSMEQMLSVIETMQARFGQGQAFNLPRRKIIAKGGMLAVMGGGLFYDGVLGMKTYTVVKGVYSFQISLYDADTGRLLCYTQANRLGQLRTGATTALAVKHLARGDTATVAILGTGYQASTQLEAVRQVRNLGQIRAYSRNAQRRQKFAETMSNSLELPVVAAGSAQEAVAGSDVVICIAATLAEPVVQGHWLTPGSTVVAAGPTTWRAREVDDVTLTRAEKLVVDSAEQAPLEAGDLASAADRGLIQWSQLVELRQVVAGNAKGRDNPRQIIYAKMMGTGVADVAAAKLAYDLAKAAGLGVELEW